MVNHSNSHTKPLASEQECQERWQALHDLEAWLQTPMVVLSFVWLVIVLAEFIWGTFKLLETFGIGIWVIFLIEFGLRFLLAPEKLKFLRSNLITITTLLVPAFRLFRTLRVLRFARATRGLRLVKVVGTANRGMNALKASLGRRGFGYVLATTIVVTLLGAAGMWAFEPASEIQGGFTSYFDALWWTAMLLTTMGSQFWPRTAEGRLLCLLLALYGFAVFGYITASFASFFIDPEAKSEETSSQISALLREVRALRDEMRSV